MTDLWEIVVSIVVSILAGGATSFLTLGKYKEKVDRLTKDTEEFHKTLREIELKVTTCMTKIDERTKSSPAAYTETKSPVTLNPNGKSLLSRSGADKFVLENQNDLVNRIREKSPKTAYDVQEFAKEAIKAVENEDRFIPLKNFAYREGLDLGVIILVTGLYLRDIALPLLNFRIEDVELTDPSPKQSVA